MDLHPTTQAIALCPNCGQDIHLRYSNSEATLTDLGLRVHDLMCGL